MNEENKVQRNQVNYSKPHSQSMIKLNWLNLGLPNSQTHAFPFHQAAFLPCVQKCMQVAQGFEGGCLGHPPKSLPEPQERFIQGP